MRGEELHAVAVVRAGPHCPTEVSTGNDTLHYIHVNIH